MSGNPDDTALRARLAQAVHDLEAVTVAMHSLEVEWDLLPRRHQRRSKIEVY
jgi:hypothetical protein